MAILLVDGQQRYEIETDENDSLLNVLLLAQDRYWGPESLIDEVWINGQKIESPTEDVLRDIPVEGAEVEVKLTRKPEPDVSVVLQ